MQKKAGKNGGREAPPHFVDEAVFAYYFSLFWVIFGNIFRYFQISIGNPKIGRLWFGFNILSILSAYVNYIYTL